MRRFTRVFLITCTWLVTVLAVVACASPTSSDVTPASVAAEGAQQVTINVGDSMQFDPAAISVRAGQPLELTLRNSGQMPHDFTLNQGAAQPVKLTVNGGGTATRTFTLEEPGTYSFDCSMPGHAMAGMRGTITAR
jgi:nitrite reductase (NO-forming)